MAATWKFAPSRNRLHSDYPLTALVALVTEAGLRLYNWCLSSCH
jgi:hypothetical protein